MTGTAQGASRRRAWAARLAKAALFLAVLGFLGHRVAQLGMGRVLSQIPAAPGFYLFFLLRYFTFSLFEIGVYQALFARPLWGAWPVFLRKRVLNFSLLDYSGEAYFYGWARRHLAPDGRPVFVMIKDANLLSSLASLSVALGLLGMAAAVGGLGDVLGAAPSLTRPLALAAGLAMTAVLIFALAGRWIISTDGATARRVFALHLARLALALACLGGQWGAALPDVPAATWLVFLALYMALTRVPLLPGKDWMFAGLGVALAGAVPAPESAVAAMFLASGAVMQVTDLVVFAATAGLRGQSAPPEDRKAAISYRRRPGDR